MDVVVTGANGLVGSRVCAALAGRGRSVRAVTRRPGAMPTPPPPSTKPANPGDTKNCGDFSTWRAAHDYFEYYYPHYGDVARLNAYNDRIACESLPGAP